MVLGGWRAWLNVPDVRGGKLRLSRRARQGSRPVEQISGKKSRWSEFRMFRVDAEVAHAIHRPESEELDTRRPVSRLDGFLTQQVRAQVLLVRVAEHRGHHGVLAEGVLRQHRREEVAAAGDADPEPELAGEFLRHD